jgi:gamma-glutamylcyclotransferase (GGCT)/AIG2-like uncharacterized protein YtfP
MEWPELLYPYLVRARDLNIPATAVYGFVAEIDRQYLTTLDDFEGVPDHYQRISVTITTDGEEFRADAYIAALPCRDQFGNQIADGVWSED